MPRKTIFLPTLAAVLLIGTTQSFACVGGPFDQAAYDRSPLIFEGSVIRTNDKDINDVTGEVLSRTYLFSIDKVWKGPAMMRNANIRNTGGGFVKGTSYLIVADNAGDGYSAEDCGHSAPLSASGAARDFLTHQATLSIEE